MNLVEQKGSPSLFNHEPEVHNLKREAKDYFFPMKEDEALLDRLKGIFIGIKLIQRGGFGKMPYDQYLERELTKRDFVPLSANVYSDGDWVVKRYNSGLTGKKGVGIFWGGIIPQDVVLSHDYNHAYRVIMQRKIAAAVKQFDWPFVVPEKYLVPLGHENGVPEYMNYLVVCKKVEILDIEKQTEAFTKLSERQQKILAQLICEFIQKTGFIDAKWSNLCFTGKNIEYQGQSIPEIALIDTEPFGLITDESDDPPARYNEIDFPNDPEREGRFSIEIAARYGLREFSHQCKYFGLKGMTPVIDSYLS